MRQLSRRPVCPPARRPDRGVVPGWRVHRTMRSFFRALPEVMSRLVAGAVFAAVCSGHLHAAEIAPPALSERDQALFANALVAMDRTKWRRALDLTMDAEFPLLHTIAKWRWLSAEDGLATWEQARDFHLAYWDWPYAEQRQRLAERRMPADLPNGEVRQWFSRFPPLTGPGQARYARALAAGGATVDPVAEAREAWRAGHFNRQEAATFLRKYRKDLTAEDHTVRLDKLIWDRSWGAATRQLKRVSSEIRRLGTARIRLGRRVGGVDAAVARVPAALKSDPGLVYERARWRRRSGLYDRALDLLLDPPRELGPRPDRWWQEVRLHARRLLNAGRYTDAYQLVFGFEPLNGVPGVEADWLAGWIALRFLGDTAAAARHFETMRSEVSMPVSIARASYWAALSTAEKRNGESERWLDDAARYPATFYGQMATWCRGGEIVLPPSPATSDNVSDWVSRPLVQAMLLFAENGRARLARLFARKLATQTESNKEVMVLYSLLRATGNTHLGLDVLRKATRRGQYLPALAFPDDVHEEAFDGVDVDVEKALLLAVARQESGFHVGARSSANARGLMQVLPSTAKFVARRERLKYDKIRLSSDASYNVEIGSRYLAGLLNDYGGAYPFALAAYNAGPGRVGRWIRRYGDPRRGEIPMLDWMELIPLSETRNYVQRVLEGLAVYRQTTGDPATSGWEMPVTCPG